MKALILVFALILMAFNAFGAWGKTETRDLTDILIIEGDVNGQYIILPKNHLTTIIDLENRKLIFQYGSAGKPMRTMVFKQRTSMLKVLEQIYPEYYCLGISGLEKCKMVDVLGGEKKAEKK